MNSGMAHAERQGVDRGVFNSTKEARQALRSMKKEITKNGFPEGTIYDPSNANRVLVPIGNNVAPSIMCKVMVLHDLRPC